MNKHAIVRSGLPFFLIVLNCLPASHLCAQEDGGYERQVSHNLPASAYTFQMVLKPDVDLTVKTKVLAKKRENSGSATGAVEGSEKNNTQDSQVPAMMIQRDVRQGVVRVTQESADAKQKSVKYYVGDWCAFDDPRRGLNVQRPSMDGFFFPMNTYHFPELLWAGPKTRQIDPPVEEGKPAIQLYKDGVQILEVDVATGRPLRYIDGSSEWKYSYQEDSTPIVIPEKLMLGLRGVLPQHKK